MDGLAKQPIVGNNAPFTCLMCHTCDRFIEIKRFNALCCELPSDVDDNPKVIYCVNCKVYYRQTADWTWEYFWPEGVTVRSTHGKT